MSDRSGPDREEVGQLSPARPAVEIVRHIRCSYVPGYAPTPPPKPVCRRSVRCDGCPYPATASSAGGLERTVCGQGWRRSTTERGEHRMRIKAMLGNAQRPEYGVVEIPFPNPKEQYDSTIKMLEGLGIGDVIQRDCKVEELIGAYPVFRRLEGQQVNVDELDYLMKLADSFFGGEDAQYQGMAYKLGLTDIKDFINLHFSFRQATVITDFSDLETIGKEHYMNIHGGSALVEELEQLDGIETALLLIADTEVHYEE